MHPDPDAGLWFLPDAQPLHLVVQPQGAGDLSRWMHWLLNTHVRRYHQHYHSSGHIWQGRFKSFPIEEDDHLLTVLRYVERNPVRASNAELAALRRSVDRGTPYGNSGWVEKTARRPGLQSTQRPRGRPRKQQEVRGSNRQQ